MNKCKTYRYRFLSRIVIEAETPLVIGSGSKSIKTNALINRDANGVPFIPGTTIAGLLRHQMDKKLADDIMGFQEIKDGCGSKLIITEGKMIDSNGNVIDGLADTDNFDEETKKFLQLPIRHHARIDHRGVTVKHGKFDEEVVMKGSRFCFEMEMISDDDKDEESFINLINVVNQPTFRVGSGSRSGFGQIEVVSSKCKYRKLDFNNPKDFNLYLSKSSSLSEEWKGYEDLKLKESNNNNEWINYKLELRPEDFLMFSSGFGNDKADNTFVRESYIEWGGDKGNIKERENVLLIPASSVKGAIAHRTAYYYNKKKEIYADKITDVEQYSGKNNEAVKELFGSEGEKEDNKTKNKKRGNVLFSDVITERHKEDKEKVLNHVAIDRFTGGAIDGALFSEEVLYYANKEDIEFNIIVNKNAFKLDKETPEIGDIQEAFQNALKDICNGLLPLGGGVNRGNGCFTGKLYREGEIVK